MKGAINYLDSDEFDLVLVNDDPRPTATADRYIAAYGMEDALRVHCPDPNFNRELLRTTGQIGWGYMVIAADGTLAGVNVSPRELREVLARAIDAEDDSLPGDFRVEASLPTKTSFNISGKLKTDREVTLKVVLELAEGYYTYGPGEENPTPTRVDIAHAGPLELGEPVFPTPKDDEGEPLPLTGKVTIEIPVRIPAGTPVGHYVVHGTVTFMACNEDGCLPPMTARWFADATYM